MVIISKRAKREDRIPNPIFKLLMEQFFLYLYRIYNNNFFLNYCFSYCQTSIKVIICKFSKLDYTIPIIYCLIALFNTWGKAFEFISAMKITYFAQTYRLFSSNQLGVRCITSTEHSLYYIIQRIYLA